jgi:hypothetical protein
MASRYENSNIIVDSRKIESDGTVKVVRRLETTLYPTFEQEFADDVYILSQEGDRLDVLAREYYGDEVFWHVIAKTNNLGKGTLVVPPGIIIRIPYYDDYAPITTMIRERNELR